MKLSVWAKQQGISYRSAWDLFKKGQLPVPSMQLVTGTIIVDSEKPLLPQGVALHARVSSSDQKNDLQAQLGRLSAFAASCKFTVTRTCIETGSGLNGHRPRLLSLLALLSDPGITTIVVEHRVRPMRFGAGYVEAALEANGRKLVVVNESQLQDDLVQDVVDVLTSTCTRRYGRRSAARRAQKAMEAGHGSHA